MRQIDNGPHVDSNQWIMTLCHHNQFGGKMDSQSYFLFPIHCTRNGKNTHRVAIDHRGEAVADE